MKKIVYLIILIFIFSNSHGQNTLHTFKIERGAFLLDGKPFQIISGEMHFARIPKEYWHDRLRMAKAMGLNTVCTYVFWNYHETEKGSFNFDGNADVAAFVKAAQEEGLWVIIRPSPYACAEWEFGGYPWWLIKEKDLKVRSRDPKFLDMSQKYINAFAKELVPLQITKGGPIIMVQVENEYGSYDNDKEYLKINRDYLRESGFNVELYTCDGSSQMPDGYLPGLLPAVNGLDDVNAVKTLINKYNNNQGPYFIAEWYPAWFDSWGIEHHTIPYKNFIDIYDSVLANGISINIYMVHGGTTRAFWNGANMPPYRPQTSSYDYDAPIDEAGNITPKYMAMREVIKKHLDAESLKNLPEIPSSKKTIKTPLINMKMGTSIFNILPVPVESINPLSFEDLNQGYGYVLYNTKVKGGSEGFLKIQYVRDYALVFVNKKRVAILDRRLNQDSVYIKLPKGEVELDVLVENMGRINYGPYLNDNRKGITDKVFYNSNELQNWKIYSLPMNDVSGKKFMIVNIHTTPVVRKGYFTLDETGDTYLDFSGWGKGCVWVNGHNLGRYWNIGPTQTVYIPAPWLKKGENEIAIFEEIKYNIDEIRGIEKPILNILGSPAIYAKGSSDYSNKSSKLELGCKDTTIRIYYTLNGKIPDNKSFKYIKPLIFKKPTIVNAIGQKSDNYSDEILKVNIYPSMSTACEVNYKTSYSIKYNAGGQQGLTDGFLGSTDYKDGFWQGFEGENMNVIIDLGESKDIKALKVNFLQDIKSWIFNPEKVEFSVSEDGKNFTVIAEKKFEPDFSNQNITINKIFVGYNKTKMAGKKFRYISVKTDNIKVCPQGHPGAGGKAWLFVDEIIVE